MFTLLNFALRTPCGALHRAGILHRESGGFAPWNTTSPVKHPSLGILAIASGRNLYRQGISFPLRFSPLNVCYSTGVRLFFKQASHKAPLTRKEGGAFLLCLPRAEPPVLRFLRRIPVSGWNPCYSIKVKLLHWGRTLMPRFSNRERGMLFGK